MQHILKMFVQGIEHTMSYAPEKEKTGNKYEWNKETGCNKFLAIGGGSYFVCHKQYCFEITILS
jgi:hypothetical protein